MAEKRSRYVRKSNTPSSSKLLSSEAARSDLTCWCPRPSVVFNVLLSARITASFLSNISDCDEVFNYWEPTHYLLYNSGFQTWEYSPAYALRSYAYILLHVAPAQIVKEFFHANKVTVFYYVRFILAIIAASLETYFFKSVQHQFGNHVARTYFLLSALSTGMFISVAAYLPSSFAMYCCFIAYGGWFNKNYPVAVFGIALGSLIGWPFFALLGVPIAYDIVIRQRNIMNFIYWTGAVFLAIMIPAVAIDSHYYGRQVIAPLNIVMYNVFGGGGPNLYGVEHWSFYFINGFLNFNLVFMMACISLPFYIFKILIFKSYEDYLKLPTYLCLLPIYVWAMVFFTTPHKEERFLFPIYPLIIMNASLTLSNIQGLYHYLFTSHNRKHFTVSSNWIAVLIVSAFTVISVARTSALYVGYHAPLEVYPELQNLVHPLDAEVEPMFNENEKITLCVGREWYRYPSSFFLPDSWKIGFIKSDFSGQLPQPYQGGADGTKAIPPHMNDMNKEEATSYTPLKSCDLLIDIDLPTESKFEDNYSTLNKTWDVIYSKDFLLASKSHPFFRAFYIPFVSTRYTTYVKYNLLKKKKLSFKQRLKKKKKQFA